MNVKGTPAIDLLLAYYADDFTGATDVLESLTTAGIATALFVEPPTAEMLRRYSHVRAIGVGGTSRTMSPDEMDAALPHVYQSLNSLRPQIVHYKTCSTFDSSPAIGSIGRAIDIGQRTFQNSFVPVVVGVPHLQRFCVFGNLFARSGLSSIPYRLDRHPTMSCHPVTPMAEADLRVHLSQQTARPVELIDVVALQNGRAAAQAIQRAQDSGSIVLFDTLTDKHLADIGGLLWASQQRERKPLFVAGSSGVEYALTKHWLSHGILSHAVSAETQTSTPQIEPVDRVIVISGSCAPVTGRQITWALEHGFAEVRFDAPSLCPPSQSDDTISDLVRQIRLAFSAGQSVVVHAGPADPRIDAAQCRLGTELGRILRGVLKHSAVTRVAVVGGDTAGQVARTLAIDALEMIGPLQPGAPLCVARSRQPDVDGLEIVFKGGQVGYDDFFGALRSGSSQHSKVGAT
jgi:uncharacterized protein YgbK (DUF1537 family)